MKPTKDISACPYTTININVTRLELIAAEHNDIPMDHCYAKRFFHHFVVRLTVGSRRDRKQCDVCTETEQNEGFGARTERLNVL